MDEMRKLKPWPIDGSRKLGFLDYVHGMLVEVPDAYFRMPGMPFMYIYVIGYGMVLVRHDFRGMTEEEIQIFVRHVRRSL